MRDIFELNDYEYGGSNSSNSSNGDLGNTKTKSQSSPSKRWVFTLNNYTEKEESVLIYNFSSNSSKYSVGRETGESGTIHLQGYIELKVKKRFSYLKSLMPRAHIEKARANREKNLIYTQKDNDFKQNFVEEIYSEEPAEKLKFLLKLMDNYDFPKGDRKIHVVVDYKGGLGKTEFARHCVMNYEDCIITGGKASDMKNQIVEYKKKNDRCPKYIIMDVPRKSCDFISYPGIEECKNMLFYSGKYEGGMINGNKPFFLMFMNSMPEVENMSEDRWSITEIGEEESGPIVYDEF